jgi:hypothetical protein
MNYDERIEKVTDALEFICDERMDSYAFDRDLLRDLARAADSACLEAIKEPTKEMTRKAEVECNFWEIGIAASAWEVMHAAIPRAKP